MKIQDMKFILEIVDTGSISMAAKNLYISQPALSQCVKKVEQELGCDLFIRHSGKVVKLTKAGSRFAVMAREVLVSYNSFLEHPDVRPGKIKSRLKIGVPMRQGSIIMTALLNHPDLSGHLDLEFLESTSDEHEQNLMKGIIDIAVIRLPLKISNLDYRIIYREPLGIWLRKGSPAESMAVEKPGETFRHLALKHLKDEVFALPPADMRISQTIGSILKEANLSPQVMKNYQSMKSILLMVENGVCCTIGKRPNPESSTDRFFLIDGCRSTYNLALVYLPGTPYKSDINLICRILGEYFESQK